MAENLPQENSRESGKGLKPILDPSRTPIAIVAFFFIGLFILTLGAGIFFFSKQPNSSDDIQIISASDDETQTESEIMIHVDGAVVNPGVYKLKSDSRINDVIVAAGGLSAEADQEKINLASKVSDGQKIHVSAVGEQGTGQSITSGQGTTSTTGLININTASESELDKLPGIGPVTAQKIIASRPYSAPEELLTKKAVSSSVWEKIKGLITVY